MALFAAKNSTRRYLQIAEALADEISNGAYREGDKLKTERDLALEHSVSRTTIREALLALEIMGYVEIRVSAGVFVLARRNWKSGDPTVGDGEIETGPHEILDLRRVLESRAAYLAAEHGTQEQIAKLSETVDVMEKNLSRLSVFDRADEAFHITLAEMSNNTLLEEYIADLWARRRGPLWDRWYKPTKSPANRRGTLEDHRLILRAIQKRRPMAASAAMHVHIDKLVLRFLELDLESDQTDFEKGNAA